VSRASRVRRPLLVGGLLAEVALVAVDAVTGEGFLARSLYLLPVLVVALRASARDVAIVGATAFAFAALSLAWAPFDQDYLIPLVVVSAGSAVAVLAAHRREAVEAERGQTRLLAETARITGGGGEIEDALGRLVELLVPDLGDAAWIDVAGPGGLRRIAARVDGDDPRLTRWLLERPGKGRGTLSRSARVLSGEGRQLSVLDDRMIAEISGGPEDEELIRASGLRTTMAVPLAVGGRILGVLSVAAGRSGRQYGAADVAFAEMLAGRAALALGNAQLVARLSAAQQRLDGILGALVEAVTVHDGEGRVLYANEAAARLVGAGSVEELLAAAPGDILARFEMSHPDGTPVGLDDLPGRRVIRGERPEPLLTRTIVRSTGEARWMLTKATPLEDEHGEVLAVNVIEDVTEAREADLRDQFLTAAGKALASSLDHAETLQRVAQLAVPRLADWCAVELPGERGRLEQVALAHVDPERVAEGRALRERYPPDPEAPTGTHAVLRTGRSQLVPEVTDEMLVAAARDEEHLAIARRMDIGSVMVVPMITGGRALGAMTFVRGHGWRYDEDDLRFAEELASRAATAVENSRLYTERAAVARTLQASLLPERLPPLPGWRTAADYRAGQAGADVGGDFYDAFPVEGGSMVILGDVTGKGVTAAALTSLVRHTAKTGAEFDPRPSAVLALVNRALRRQPRIAPVTMLCAHLRQGELTVAVGGHPLPLLKRAGAPPSKVGEPGLLLGAVDDYDAVRDVVVPLAPGDTVLLYTDGVTDTSGEDGRFGESRLLAALEAAPVAPDALLEHLRAALQAFEHGAIADDRAMLALQYTGLAEAEKPGRGYPAAAASSRATVPRTTALADAPFSK